MISLSLALILGARENTRRMEIECVTDTAMNNVLAEYHRELLNQYDLFFIDTSYGSSSASYLRTANHVRSYLEYNLGDEGLVLSALYRDPMKLEVENVRITEASVASDEAGAVLRKQAVDVMSQQVGIAYLKQLQGWLDTVTEYEMDSRDIKQEQQEIAEELSVWEGELKLTDTEIPGSETVSFWQAGMLNFVVEDISTLSAQRITLEDYISHREMFEGTGFASGAEFADGWWEQLVFQEYLIEYTAYYGKEKAGAHLQYQVEYILAGEEEDVKNLQEVVDKLLALRAVANTVYLYSDTDKMKVLEVASTAIATLITQPQMAGLIKNGLVLNWAMSESLYDVTQLLAGNKVPLLKSREDWHYDWKELLSATWKIEPGEEGHGLCYEDYLRILLCLQDKEVTTYRLMDVMEMDIRKTAGNSHFRMDGCIDSLTAVIFIEGRDGKDYQITRSYGY